MLFFHSEKQHAEPPETHAVPHRLGRRHRHRRVPGLLAALAPSRAVFGLRLGRDVGLFRVFLFSGDLRLPFVWPFAVHIIWSRDLGSPGEGSGPRGDAAAVVGVACNEELSE